MKIRDGNVLPSAGVMQTAQRRSFWGPSMPIIIVLWFFSGPIWDGLTAAPAANEIKVNNLILSVEGQVEVSLAGTGEWKPARAGLLLNYGDRVRTGANSRALIQHESRILFRLGALTLVAIRPKPGGEANATLDLNKGMLYFLGRDKPDALELRTPVVTAAIRGTEFHIQVEEGGQTKLTLFEGFVDLINPQGRIDLGSGEQGTVQAGLPPCKTAFISAINLIQWTLYYPGVLWLDDLDLEAAERMDLSQSLAAFQAGDLPQALAMYPAGRRPVSEGEKTYFAALLLTAGQVAEAENTLAGIDSAPARALRILMAAVKFEATDTKIPGRGTASEWLAISYYHQSRSQLEAALKAVSKALEHAPDFGFAHARRAELEFSCGRIKTAERAVDRALQVAPRNAQAMALKGFLLSAHRQSGAASAWFSRAIELDSALGNAWLGRGLCKIRMGDIRGGREEVQTAAALEPNRALLRSYLGKAFNEERENRLGINELALAKKLDANDPTPWLYSALLARQENRINAAVRDLEKSQALNDNRSVYRSRLLLDQDRAVRSANLAAIYRDAGLDEVSAREAALAASIDYANYSAHLFLASSYANHRDALQGNLRYETPTLNELLLANLLAPPGVGMLSQSVSQQEYSRLFDQNHLGFYSGTEYSSGGDWRQATSQYGAIDGSSYALDQVYEDRHGQRPNADFHQNYLSGGIKQQLSAQDSIMLQGILSQSHAGDLTQYYDPGLALLDLRAKESQEPTMLAGYHREWSPGNHTLISAGRIIDTLEYAHSSYDELLLFKNQAGQVIGLPKPQQTGGTPYPVPPMATIRYADDINLYTAEIQQVIQAEPLNLVIGSRYQDGTMDISSGLGQSTRTRLGNASYYLPKNIPWAVYYTNPPVSESYSLAMQRFSAYGYGSWQVAKPLQLTAGVAYDLLDYPENHLWPPLSNLQESQDQVSPKAGLIWTPWKLATLRGTYTRSLGGVSIDQSFRLEPSLVGGFNQSYRSLIPESVTSPTPGTGFETFNLGFDQKFPSGTYLGIEAERLESQAERTIGGFEVRTMATPAVSSFLESLDYQETNLRVSADQLLGEYWTAGIQYRLSGAELDEVYPQIPATVNPDANTNREAELHQVILKTVFNHSSGFFAQAEAVWSLQQNRGFQANLMPGDDFWQENLHIGYRFPRRTAEIRLGLLNLSDQDYRLNPLNLHADLPRGRTFTASLKFNF